MWSPSQQTIDWLSKSIPGIILLGALGSIAALFVLKLAKFMLRGVLGALSSLVESFVKTHFVSTNLVEELNEEQDKTPLLVYSMFNLVITCIWILTFFIFLSTTMFLFIVKGVSSTLTTYALLIAVFLTLYSSVKRILSALVLYRKILRPFADVEDHYYEKIKSININSRLKKVDSDPFANDLSKAFEEIGIHDYKHKGYALMVLLIWTELYPKKDLTKKNYFDSYFTNFLLFMAKKHPSEHQTLLRRSMKRFLIDEKPVYSLFKAAMSLNSYERTRANLRSENLL